LRWFYFPEGLKVALHPKLEEAPRTAREYQRRQRRLERERTRKTALALYVSGKTCKEVSKIQGMPSERTIKRLVKEAELEMHPVMAQLLRDVASIKKSQERLLQWAQDYPEEAKAAQADIYRDDEQITSAVADFQRMH
jgi:hypothetical protein